MSPSIDPKKGAKERLLGLNRAVHAKLDQPVVLESGTGDERQLTRLLEIAKAMNRIHDQDQLLAYVSERLRELFDAQNSFVILFDSEGEPVIQASHVRDVDCGSMPVSRTLLEYVRGSREPLIIDDAASHSELRSHSSIEQLKIASAMCAPLIVDDEVIGILQFDQRGDPHPFPSSDLRLLSLFADQVATVLNNQCLLSRVQDALAETKLTQSRLVESERLSALGEMAGGIAHNFNNTLFVALGLCDVLLAKDIQKDVRDAVDRIRTCSLDAANMVRRLRTFSNGPLSDSGELTILPSTVVSDLPILTRHKWKDEAVERGVRIEMRVEAGTTPPVRARAADLREILTNLIFNAVDSMQSDGKITISTGTEGERVFIRIADEGVGMDETLLRKIFEPFFTTKGAKGSGFGLSTCWSIARSLGGEITVDSVEGEGSTFTLWMRSSHEAPRSKRPSAKLSTVPGHIFIVDDDPAVLRTMVELTRLLGYQVSSFGSGAEVLDALELNEPDLLFSDVGMPEMSGNDLARRAFALRPELPVVLLTGWCEDLALDPEIHEFVATVLTKPVTLDLLKETISQVLRARTS